MKERLSVSVDTELIEAAEQAVARGRFESMSAWVNEALRSKIEQDRRLEALAAFIAAYESEHGEITPEEMRLAARRARSSAVPVRDSRVAKKAGARPRGRTR
jgi:Arc/MetJ-type ribon-helix-helix transcriptional regulator